MGTTKRERQKQGRQARVAAATAAQQRRQRIKSVRNFAIIIVAIIAALFLLSRYNDDDDSSSTGSGEPVQITVPPPGASLTGPTPCPSPDGSSARTTTFAGAPPACIDPAKTYTATLATTKGPITITLDSAAAPETVNNFVVLARYHYYDGVAFHRVITGKIDQAGDANGPTPGEGGPGYTIPDEWPEEPNPYGEGSVAMANRGASNTGGSQFFIVVGTGGAGLPPQYSLFGTVSAGLDVANAINAVGTDDGPPTEEVTITSVTITES